MKSRVCIFLLLLAAVALAGCGATGASTGEAAGPQPLALPALTAVDLNGRPLQVVATTSIIGDVVGQVAGDAAQVTTLMDPGQDPHSYQPTAADLAAAAEADVIFVNGWNLEEGLVADLASAGETTPVVAISAGITPLAFGADDHAGVEEADHAHDTTADPHVWFAVPNVMQWTQNAEQVLSELDPANAAAYAANAAAYRVQLEALDDDVRAQVTQVPPARRVLVTNHDSLAYFAAEYGFEVLGTVIPGASTIAEPSASDLAQLIAAMEQEGVCTLFTETTVSTRLAETAAAELNDCDAVEVLTLYTGSVGAPGSGIDTYVEMMRANVNTIVQGLQ